MKSLPQELIYVLVFAAVMLVQYLTWRLGRRSQGEALLLAPRSDEEPAAQEELAADIWGRAPAIPAVAPALVEPVGRSEALAASAAIARRRSAVRSLLGTRRDLRRAIVSMTILGPCRAQEPPDNR